MPSKIGFIYSDGSRAKLPVEWSAVDVNQPGIFTVKGVADGRDVEARVEVLALQAELPVVKRIAPTTDLSTVDPSVSYVLSDGTLGSYDVDRWEIAAEDQAKLTIPGSRIQAKGISGDDEIAATFVVAEGQAASPVVPTVTVADQPVEGLSTDQPVLYHKLAYGAALPEVKALAENAQVTVIQADEANGMRASIYVQPNDGGALQTYAIQFLQEAPQIERLSLEVENADAKSWLIIKMELRPY